MLMFNLHGADAEGMCGFYSEDEAFNPSLLNQGRAEVFNTVACFGARYAGYKRNDSMLLSALYGGGVLLYTGSLIPVPMFSNEETDEARQLLLNPGTGSEVLMRLYPLYQFKGMTGGKAMLQAKCDSFNMCRHVEDDCFSMSTALMFCLYGNPMLHVRRREYVVESALQNDAMPPAPIKADGSPLKKTMRQRLLQKDKSNQSLIDQIRGYVDENLNAIRNMVEQHLYQQLGLKPEMLDSWLRPGKPTYHRRQLRNGIFIQLSRRKPPIWSRHLRRSRCPGQDEANLYNKIICPLQRDSIVNNKNNNNHKN